jgi:AcrR family transcriptional regulator
MDTLKAPLSIRRAAVEPRPDRKHAILLAAEKLFASYGYHAVSIRQIAEEAGVPLALVGYYYGPKHELFKAIFEHWNQTREERLLALRQAANSPTDPLTLQRIIQAFVLPVLRLRASPEGEYYALLVARQLSSNIEEVDTILREYFDPLAHAFIDALQSVFPGSTRGQIAWCYQFALGALLHHISDERVIELSHGECRLGSTDTADRLVRFIVGGMHVALEEAPPA